MKMAAEKPTPPELLAGPFGLQFDRLLETRGTDCEYVGPHEHLANVWQPRNGRVMRHLEDRDAFGQLFTEAAVEVIDHGRLRCFRSIANAEVRHHRRRLRRGRAERGHCRSE